MKPHLLDVWRQASEHLSSVNCDVYVAQLCSPKTARDESFDEIADWFETLAKAERSHANRFQKALDSLDD